MVKFSSLFYNIEKDVQDFLRERNRNYSLWRWALAVPLLEQRFYNLVTASDAVHGSSTGIATCQISVFEEPRKIGHATPTAPTAAFCRNWRLANA